MDQVESLKKLLREETDHIYDQMKILEEVKIVDETMENLELRLSQVTDLIGEVSFANYRVFRHKLNAQLSDKKYLLKTVTDILDSFGKETYSILVSLRTLSDNIRFLLGRK